MKKLLVPIDRSEEAIEALEFALVEYPDAEVTVLHVIDAPSSIYDEAGMTPILGETRKERLDAERELASEIFEKAEDTAKEHGKTVQTAIEEGRPRNVIINYANENEFDQIIIGSHGRTGTSRILLGSVAENVVRRASIPVTIVR